MPSGFLCLAFYLILVNYLYIIMRRVATQVLYNYILKDSIFYGKTLIGKCLNMLCYICQSLFVMARFR